MDCALERIKNASVNNIGLVHRGFTSFGNDEYRKLFLANSY